MISDCHAVEAIIDTEGEELSGEMIFPSLELLNLSLLPNLKRFCLDPLWEKQVNLILQIIKALSIHFYILFVLEQINLKELREILTFIMFIYIEEDSIYFAKLIVFSRDNNFIIRSPGYPYFFWNGFYKFFSDLVQPIREVFLPSQSARTAHL